MWRSAGFNSRMPYQGDSVLQQERIKMIDFSNKNKPDTVFGIYLGLHFLSWAGLCSSAGVGYWPGLFAATVGLVITCFVFKFLLD